MTVSVNRNTNAKTTLQLEVLKTPKDICAGFGLNPSMIIVSLSVFHLIKRYCSYVPFTGYVSNYVDV